jgi:hypothetical protein
MVAPPGGVVKGPEPSVVLKTLSPGEGRWAGSIYVPLSAEPILNCPRQTDEVSPAQEPPMVSDSVAALSRVDRPKLVRS